MGKLEQMMHEASYLVQQGDFRKALKSLQKAQSEWPMEPLVYFNQGMVYYFKKKYKMALKKFNESISLGGADPDLFNQWGLCLDHLNRRKEAREAYLTALSLDEQYWKALNNLGVLAFLEEDYPQAIEYFNQTLSLNPSNGDTWYNLRDSYREVGDHVAADYADQRYQELCP
ncbi:tetratricopeptide repeat protein [Spirochaeta cellobiosiphila]|uniref:tetratricopeptide repeat protein n=1 Tax=Spirochaeta cellobiosiphila TaxID=504483 RepID=UPI000421FD60|nr:tetratricopeptide repeat protein [Spirochaeta cellobiosiphila]